MRFAKNKINLSIQLADTIKNCLKITDVLRMKYYFRFEDMCHIKLLHPYKLYFIFN